MKNFDNMMFFSIRIVFVFLGLIFTTLQANDAWYFLPNFQYDIRGVEKPVEKGECFQEHLPNAVTSLIAPNSPLTEEQRKKVFWHSSKFPHRDYVKLMPERNTFGWYGCLFDIPAELHGLDIIVDLGIIDDTDEAFVNGKRIGGVGLIGKPNGLAWQTDRLYRIPNMYTITSNNYLAIHVWNLWGLGGIVGPPVLKASVVSSDAQWELAFVSKNALSNLNDIRTTEALFSVISAGEKIIWEKAAIPWKGYADWKDYSNYAVFRLKFDILYDNGLPRRFASPVVMDMGPIFDVASFYLNGKRVGFTGRFPENDSKSAFSEAAQRAQFIVKPEDWAIDGRNELVIVVYREHGVGGIPGVPGLLLNNPLNDMHSSFSNVSNLFNIYIQSEMFHEANSILDKAITSTDIEQVWLLSHHANLAFIKWFDGKRNQCDLLDEVIKSIADILSKYPNEAPKQSAMQAFCYILRLAEHNDKILNIVRKYFPLFATKCVYLNEDRKTKGNWPFYYGNRFYVLAAMGQICDWTSGSLCNPLKYRTFIPANKDFPRQWLDINSRYVDWKDALLMHGEYQKSLVSKTVFSPGDVLNGMFCGEKIRRGAWWDDHGEMHPFDDEGPDFIVSCELADECCSISCYLTDLDWRKSLHPRQQSVLVFDDNNEFLNACWTGKNHTGVYERFVVNGCHQVSIRLNKHRSSCVAVSGFFVDIPPVVFWKKHDLDKISFLNSIMETLNNSEGLDKIRIARSCAKMLQSQLLLAKDANSLYALALCKELSFESYEMTQAIVDAFGNLGTVQDAIDLLEQFNGGNHFHFVWHYMVFARIHQMIINEHFELDAKSQNALFRAYKSENLYVLSEILNKSLLTRLP